jgi:hypothetical protein
VFRYFNRTSFCSPYHPDSPLKNRVPETRYYLQRKEAHLGRARAKSNAMKAPVLILLLCGFAPAQQSSANRAIAATPPPRENFLVRLLHPLEPEQYAPITEKTRLSDYVCNAFCPYYLLSDAAGAGIRQAMNSPHEWGGGMAGYGERFGNALGFAVAHNTISYGLSSALHEDNRYFASGKTSTARRALHAALSPFVARHDDGSAGFSYSNVAGVLGASAVSLAWAPPSWQSGQHYAADIGITFASEAAFNVFREFLPDLLHHR